MNPLSSYPAQRPEVVVHFDVILNAQTCLRDVINFNCENKPREGGGPRGI